jgi:hypothetical protein
MENVITQIGGTPVDIIDFDNVLALVKNIIQDCQNDE